MLTSDEIAARTERAVDAAASAGRGLGLPVDDPRVLYDVFSVIVHLVPAPVVVRVPTVVPPSYRETPAQQTAQQRAELAVAGWLADRGHPVVAPSSLVPREPVRLAGFSMTFWEFVEEVPDDDADMSRRFEMTARLHAALREYPGDGLGFWGPYNAYIPDGLRVLARRPDLLAAADVQRAQREWSRLAPLLASRAGLRSAFDGVDVQTIHGDAPFYNLIPTADGLKWSDFELVTSGAVESDLVMAGPDGVAAYEEAAVRLGLRRLDRRLLHITEAAGQLATVAALAMAPELPMLSDAVKPVVDMWRAAPEVNPG
ncbi:aminoglycoside phosphotransferase family protein [Mycolicibacterium sp. S2-37]|uniref:aminoglycoside phosphotransferase family protein n=1 Tax=Mycolicibacterium sp. S2-37 TaxID=2810297 RepID=UPI001A94988F|nr:aminoglycoside phosphotransferase family protein [Mycolicibacterium sp. S2-37]MBO0676200.1 aminoglycoside phosphotransferase family protein [Mycolicibacterium sp. S2-37]